ncbi:hypothetical protein [Streptomyces pseudogriseolus]|uniref:hypothetical protein n=1 Tax=Streptomyces pseudogriseolus TaxID=36817 RepID=UPI003FA2466C
MSAIDWGSVPTWFSAIGTSGSLVATTGIIVRDRRKAQRADAARVVGWVEALEPGEIEDGTRYLLVHNTADRPVFDVSAMTGPDAHGTYRRKYLAHVVGADTPSTFSVPSDAVALEFRDVERTVWVYDFEAGTLHRRRNRRVRSWLRLQRRFISEFGWKAFNLRFRRRVARPKRPKWR